ARGRDRGAAVRRRADLSLPSAVSPQALLPLRVARHRAPHRLRPARLDAPAAPLRRRRRHRRALAQAARQLSVFFAGPLGLGYDSTASGARSAQLGPASMPTRSGASSANASRIAVAAM